MHPPENPNRLLFALGFFAAGLVALGVGGELYAEAQIAMVETCVRKGNDALFLLLSKEAGDAAKSAKTAHDEADAVKAEADALKIQLAAVARRATGVNESLTQTIKALSQPELSAREVEDLTDALLTCPDRDTTGVLVHAVFTSQLGIPIFNALRAAGFTKADLNLSRITWLGNSIHGSLKDHNVTECIQGVLLKKIVLLGPMGVSDPPGSPITIEIGEQPLGALPK